jgi:plastocyanin
MKRGIAMRAVFTVLLLVAAAVRAGETVEVGIDKMKFIPETLTVKAGTTVKWVNHERRNNHSVLFPAESLESERFFPGESWSRTFDKPGNYAYTCGPHPEMKGLVEVLP